MTHVAIMKAGPTGEAEKYAEFPTEAEAVAHVAAFAAKYPDAYVAPHPGRSSAVWRCDPVAKTVTLDLSMLPQLTLAEKMAPFERPSLTARKIEDALVLLHGLAQTLPPPTLKWVNDRRALRGEPPL